MSKLELQSKAKLRSGVSFEESLEATLLVPSLYERIGEDGLYQLSLLFYDRVFADQENVWFLNIFASSSKNEAVDNQYRFLVQTFGGPELYREKKGKYTRLTGRHASYQFGHAAAERWIQHMKGALEDHESLQHDLAAKKTLIKYFSYTAHYIVLASEYMRPDQVSASMRAKSVVGRDKWSPLDI